MSAQQELLDHGFFIENPEKDEYYITQIDNTGEPARYRITKSLYDFYAEEKGLANKLSNWDKNHRDLRELEIMLIAGDYIRASERMNTDRYVRELLDDISLVLKSCTDTEQRRFVLKFVKGFTYVEIARIESRSEASVKESVYKVLEKLNKIIIL